MKFFKPKSFKIWALNLVISMITMPAAQGLNLEDALPQSTAAQKEFAQLVKDQKFTEALMAWGPTHSRSDYAKSHTGIAVQAYLLAKSGLPLLGSHWIVADTNLNKISKKIRPLIVNLIQQNAGFLTEEEAHKSWKNFLMEQNSIQIQSRKDINRWARTLAKTPKSDIKRRAEIYWALSVGASKINDLRLAEIYIRDLKGLDQKYIAPDKVEMQYARVLFQKNKLNEAIDSYSLISKQSEFWLEAIEERAWAYLKLGNYDKARSDVTTLMAPTFKDYATAEVFVLAAITNLRICDYPQILKDNKRFKETHSERIQEIELLAEKGSNSKIGEILEKMDQTGADLSAAAGKLKYLPRLALRSSKFSFAVNQRAQLVRELQTAKDLSERLNTLGGNVNLAKLQDWAKWQSQKDRTQSLRELKSLAKAEIKDYRININKLKLAEVEVIHHMNIDDSLKGRRGDLGDVSYGKDKLIFPYDDEVWIDELDNYQAQVKDCPTKKGASL